MILLFYLVGSLLAVSSLHVFRNCPSPCLQEAGSHPWGELSVWSKYTSFCFYLYTLLFILQGGKLGDCTENKLGPSWAIRHPRWIA